MGTAVMSPAPAPDRRPAAPLTAKGLFRPASAGYSFAQRLSESLVGADAVARG